MSAFRIGKVFGIDIRVDASWVFIFGLDLLPRTSVFALPLLSIARPTGRSNPLICSLGDEAPFG